MKALTLTQPWAGLVASGIKLVENRPRKMIKGEDFGTPFAIHASRAIDEDVYIHLADAHPEFDVELTVGRPESKWWKLSRITSAIIGVATVVTYVTDAKQLREYTSPEQGRWFFGPIGYVLRDVRALARPVPCKGALGFWRLPPDVERHVVEQLP